MTARLVLIADDDRSVRRLLRRILDREFGVVEAEDGVAAVALARSERPSVVLLDLNMPLLDGHGALLRLRSDPGLRTTPVLIVTGAAISGEDAAACLRDGAHDFVRKPFEETELVGRVNAAFRHKALEDELRRRNRELEAFASFAAHDLKSPLCAIATIADLLATKGFSLEAGARTRFLADIADLAAQGSRLVADLLALAREDWVGAAVVPTPIDVEPLVRTVVDEGQLDNARVDIVGSWTKVLVPEAAMRSVLGNLVSNANYYGRGDSGTLDLAITGATTPDEQQILVEDQGAGIDPRVIDRIFDPFVVGPGSAQRNPSSTGLGLALVTRTLERHGGGVDLVDGRAAGAAFRVRLPRATSEAPEFD